MTKQSDSNTLGKKDVANFIATKTGCKKGDAELYVDAFLEFIVAQTGEGKKIQFRNIGAFTKVERAARTARNPHTGASIEVDAKATLKFKPAASFSY